MKKEEDFVMGLSIYMVCLREKKRYSTAKSYQDALNSFKCFCGMEAIPYAYINRNRLLCYQSWLLDKGRSLNTVSTYMRRIRHIYNLAVEANEAPFVPNLFKDVFTGVESKRKKALPQEMLERMFNAPLEVDREVDASLSGGEVKRIEIATILARSSQLMIFDEPEAGIDLWSFARLTETFEQIHASGTATMIIISHQERIISLADEIIVVGDGELRHRGTPEEILPQILADTLSGCPVLTKEGAAV